MNKPVPKHWIKVDRKTFDEAMKEINWIRDGFGGADYYRLHGHPKDIAASDRDGFYLNPEYFKPTEETQKTPQ